ncbi:hypothetical protein K503DRAFT_802546 [Rhizopogon vinicolor AM-OR11-026]|uniref:F-box domain-containing protein n=1 Tax=Rhizopogon vinicolor AM-OR11-026 TaxID=1314800 RepID=A0A1B7MT43_9AGAM|nr:hypothetical protein K503DRAFT_802546 [Rhizopogon vinicolor AM-OR11-026]
MYIYLLPTEIIFAILQSVYYNGLFLYDHAAITVLARTCRAFKEPALDLLWKDMWGFERLISCLPEGVSKITPEGWTLTRPLSPGEWNTVARYSHRIRSLTINESNLGRIDDRIVQALISTPSRAPLLPNLRSLEWWDERERFLPLLHTLLVPTIRSMKLGCASHKPWAPSFTKSALLACLAARCPATRELVCAYTDDSHVICEFICGWQELFHLEMGDLNTQSLRHLASLPSLKSLCFKTSYSDGTQPYSTPIFFSRLDEVSITAPAPFLFNQCLKGVRFPSCRSVVSCVGEIEDSEFTYNFKEIPEPPYNLLNIPDLISSLSTSFSHTLERISINFFYLDIAGGLADPHLVLGFDAVTPLLSFNRLTELDLNFFCTSAIDDSRLKIMA